MSNAIEAIVDAYVKVKDRGALEALLAQRRKVLTELRSITALNTDALADVVETEIASIQSGLEKLKPPAGSLPENEWR